MRSASDSVDRISEKLETTAAADLPHVYGRAAEKVCTGAANAQCAGAKIATRRKNVLAAFVSAAGARQNRTQSDFDVPFLTRCNRAMELRDAVNGEYRELLAKESARMRAEQVRAIVEEHFRPRRRCSATWRRNSSSTSALMRTVQSRCARSCATASSRRLKSAAASINSAA